MTEDQYGPLIDCPREHLVSSDAAFIKLHTGSSGLPGLWPPEAYAYHSARLMVDADILVEQAVTEIEALAMQKLRQATMLVRKYSLKQPVQRRSCCHVPSLEKREPSYRYGSKQWELRNSGVFRFGKALQIFVYLFLHLLDFVEEVFGDLRVIARRLVPAQY
jgi:hypothetical protein